LLILIVIASLTIANAGECERYVVQPGAPVATSVEALRKGKVTINHDYKIVYAVKVKGMPQMCWLLVKIMTALEKSTTLSTNMRRRNLAARPKPYPPDPD
jgi:hypothetical protein